MDDLKWYALQVITGAETDVMHLMVHYGFETILPYVPMFFKRGGKISLMKRPLLPGYVFTQSTPEALSQIKEIERLRNQQRKIIRVCGNGSSAVPLDNNEISFFHWCSENMKPLIFEKEKADRHTKAYFRVLNPPPWAVEMEIVNYDQQHFQAEAIVWCGEQLQKRKFEIAAYPYYYSGAFANQLHSLS